MSESPKTTDVTAGADTITDPAEAVVMSVVGDAAKAAVDPAQARSATSAVAAAQPATTGRAGHRGTSGAAPVSRAPTPENGAGSSELAMSSGPQAFPPASAGVESGDGPAAGSVPDRVWKVLLTHPGSTPAELATAGGVGRSTVSKLLANWADAGRVTSATGVNARAARLWTATPAASTPAPQAEGESGRRARRRASGAGGHVGESTATPQAPPADPVTGRCGSPRVAVRKVGDAEPHVAVVVSTARMPGSNCTGATRLGAWGASRTGRGVLERAPRGARPGRDRSRAAPLLGCHRERSGAPGRDWVGAAHQGASQAVPVADGDRYRHHRHHPRPRRQRRPRSRVRR